jgi:hypothetical protein
MDCWILVDREWALVAVDSVFPFGPFQSFDVGVGQSLEPFLKNLLRVGLALAEGDGLNSAGSGCQSEASDAGEEIEVGAVMAHALTSCSVHCPFTW